MLPAATFGPLLIIVQNYNTQNYYVSGLYLSLSIPNNYKTAFQKVNLFPSSGERRETPTLLVPLERANLSYSI
jgi:hypothetical protein